MLLTGLSKGGGLFLSDCMARLLQSIKLCTYTVVVSLDDLQEEGGAVLHGLGEDLQQVALVIVVHQDLKTLELGGVRGGRRGRGGRGRGERKRKWVGDIRGTS